VVTRWKFEKGNSADNGERVRSHQQRLLLKRECSGYDQGTVEEIENTKVRGQEVMKGNASISGRQIPKCDEIIKFMAAAAAAAAGAYNGRRLQTVNRQQRTERQQCVSASVSTVGKHERRRICFFFFG